MFCHVKRGCLLILTLLLPGVVSGGDWPQILGPARNGDAADEQIADSWEGGKPETLWQREVGEGYAGVAVADGTAVLFHRVGDNERVEAMNAKTGEVHWKADFPTRFFSAYSSDNGPRSVPLIHGGRVYAFGAQGGLRCLDLKTGKTLWSRQTHREFGAPEGYFGAGSAPIIEDGKIIVNVGARDGAGIVAFDLAGGKTLWKAVNDAASYSSPVAATIDGVRHLIFVTRMKTLSLDPRDGSVRFEFPFGKRGPTVNAASPLLLDDKLFVSSHYGVGAVYGKIGKNGFDSLWESDEVMSNHYMTCVAHEDCLYGIHGQERLDQGELRCLDPRTKKVLWSRPGFGYATMIKADGKLVAVTTEGEALLLQPNPRGYRELARSKVLAATTRALPALAAGRLYVRDTQTLKCLDLR